ncbi:DUF2634 domain-containing protein [Paenibacillus sp. MMS20-IR301]|uniref:DUF2634 domain-containing protein n=1 Tax=Paenibacillus sp. MMS20-IR301 TaxID=2895946 RepID=UPI0028E2B6D9|nr:DUF2634 domain-containing protein [Paenibacillus sp. MMS20-IR301]WNS42850.1 DUF2634 domain-containing protein [Paenibacillus sp. MMS20-IR301]
MIPAIGRSGPISASLNSGNVLISGNSPSLTYRIDWERGRIAGLADGLEAVKQAAVKVLQTNRFEHLIYSPDYGMEWNLVLGQDRLLVRPELRRLISEALLQDERIQELTDVDIQFSGDTVSFSCTAVTVYGSFELRKEEITGV